MRNRKQGKLNPRFMGPYRIIERVGPLAYRLALPNKLAGFHDVFHVSQLRKHIPNPRMEVPKEEVEVHQNLTYIERLVKILDYKEKRLRSKSIPLVKVQWNHRSDWEATWELEEDLRRQFPKLFVDVMEE
ncbi:uncharacterized protein LOC127791582 [Diospyros lotus]|uniref:uncharacterized protein LOC127791582 n=1 Tax=Diospyros lotus TaxID=55363 RepID=UPI00225B7279|nr:uncharacterized protein LOC127791582 [Diospyros lotus]